MTRRQVIFYSETWTREVLVRWADSRLAREQAYSPRRPLRNGDAKEGYRQTFARTYSMNSALLITNR